MNLNVTNIKIDNEHVDEVLWVKSGGTSIHTGMTLTTPLKFNIDEYTLENPGETAIITVRTDNGIYKDIELNRCTPNCDCDVFDVVCESSKYIDLKGGTVDFTYYLKDEFVGKCSESKISCHTKSSFVTITHDSSNNKFRATIGENSTIKRKARIVFSYGGENCKVFTVTQGAPVDNCNDKLIVKKQSEEKLTCQGGDIQFVVETSPFGTCNEKIKIKAENNETTVPCAGGDVQYIITSAPPAKCNDKIILETTAYIISSDGETIRYNVTAPFVSADYDARYITSCSITPEVDGTSYEIVEDGGIYYLDITFPPNEITDYIKFTVRCEDNGGNCGTATINQDKKPNTVCNIQKVYDEEFKASGEENLRILQYSFDLCDADNMSFSSNIEGVGIRTSNGRVLADIPENTGEERDVIITVTQERDGVSEVSEYTFKQKGRSSRTDDITFTIVNTTNRTAYFGGKIDLGTSRQPGSRAGETTFREATERIKGNVIKLYMNGVTDDNLTHNHFDLGPGESSAITVSWSVIESLGLENHYFVTDNSQSWYNTNQYGVNGKSGIPAIKFYHVAKRPMKTTTGVEPNEFIVHVRPIAYNETQPVYRQILKGKTYRLEIYRIDDDIEHNNDIHWNGSKALPVRQPDSTDNYVKFKYGDNTCADAKLILTQDGYKWEDTNYGLSC